jgi:uncharacterized membrane protein YeaQ/YmgE (transglycosylase-associated protein family)
LHWLQRTGFDLLGDIVVGILGALIATWLFPVLDIALAILAFIGAVILLVIVKVITQLAA